MQWRKDNVTPSGGRHRARRIYPLGSCELCGDEARDRHHVDGDTNNNRPSNVLILCRRCHMELDGRLEQLKANGSESSKRIASEQTVCKNGHSLTDPANVYHRPDRPNSRGCRRCRADAEKERRWREWKKCGHHHRTREAREICERRLNRLAA